MKIKKNGVTINLSESDISRISKTLLKEQRADIIQQGDTDSCLIVCDTKHAKIGSNGLIVKQIQHALADGGFNVPRGGGGRTHTRNAVKEFQKKYKLTPDGIVGPLTLKIMCEKYGGNVGGGMCPDCKCDDNTQRPGDPPKDTDKDPEKRFPDIDIYNPNIGDKECGTIVSCLRKVMTGTPGMSAVGTNKWELFLKCIGKLKDKVFPPKKNIGKCKGCPKYVWYGPQVQGGGKEYWKRKGFETGCVRDKCSIATKDYRLYDNWKKSQRNA